MTSVPFRQRFGLDESKPIDNDFPESARIALAYLIKDLKEQRAFSDFDGDGVATEALRTGRLTNEECPFDRNTSFFSRILEPLKSMRWWQIYTFCERIFRYHLGEAGWVADDEQWVVSRTKEEVRAYFTSQVNEILAEENMAYRFQDGQFQRQGRAHTQRSFQRVGNVLVQARFNDARNHYNKARKFFDMQPEPDVQNCVKEAICALEAGLETLSQRPASKEFAKVVKQLEGNGARQIPPPIAEGMIRLHGYRGSGQGVAHAATTGNRVTAVDAELVLSLVASYITYLADILTEEEEIPF